MRFKIDLLTAHLFVRWSTDRMKVNVLSLSEKSESTLNRENINKTNKSSSLIIIDQYSKTHIEFKTDVDQNSELYGEK